MEGGPTIAHRHEVDVCPHKLGHRRKANSQHSRGGYLMNSVATKLSRRAIECSFDEPHRSVPDRI